jgi:hypothetical protein
LVEVRARAREASWPANTVRGEGLVLFRHKVKEWKGEEEEEGTVVRAAFLVGLVSGYVEDFALF